MVLNNKIIRLKNLTIFLIFFSHHFLHACNPDLKEVDGSSVVAKKTESIDSISVKRGGNEGPVFKYLEINDGDNYTSAAEVILNLETNSNSVDMYITNSSDCLSGGDWEPITANKTWTLGQSNAETFIYAKVRDTVGNESGCQRDGIIHDNKGPVYTGKGGLVEIIGASDSKISISWSPGSDNLTLQENLRYQVYYSSNDKLDTLENILANGTPVNEFSVQGNETLTNLDTIEDTFYFNVVVQDESGNKTVYKQGYLKSLSEISPSNIRISSSASTLFSSLSSSWQNNHQTELNDVSLEISLGTTEGLNDIVDWTPINSNLVNHDFNEILVQAGISYHANIRIIDQFGRKGYTLSSTPLIPLPIMGDAGLMLSENVIRESEVPLTSTIDLNNRILIAGYVARDSDDAAVWRYNLDGTLDTSFGTEGMIVWDSPGGKREKIEKIRVKSDGTIVLGGISQDATDFNKPLYGKFDQNGQPIAAFSPDGFRILSENSNSIKYFLGNTIIDDQDRLTQLRYTDGLGFDLFMMRHSSIGAFDTAFGTNGFLQWDHTSAPILAQDSAKEYVGSGVYDSGFYYVIVGRQGTGADFVNPGLGSILKINAINGTVVDAIIDVPCEIWDLSIEADKIYFSGNKPPEENYCWGRADKTAFTLDLDYGTDGISSFDTSLASVEDRSYHISVNGDGELFLCGYASINGRDGKLVKIASNGDIDQNFGTNGIISFSDLYKAVGVDDSCITSLLLPNKSMYIVGHSAIEIDNIEYKRIYIQYNSQN